MSQWLAGSQPRDDDELAELHAYFGIVPPPLEKPVPEPVPVPWQAVYVAPQPPVHAHVPVPLPVPQRATVMVDPTFDPFGVRQPRNPSQWAATDVAYYTRHGKPIPPHLVVASEDPPEYPPEDPVEQAYIEARARWYRQRK